MFALVITLMESVSHFKDNLKYKNSKFQNQINWVWGQTS